MALISRDGHLATERQDRVTDLSGAQDVCCSGAAWLRDAVRGALPADVEHARHNETKAGGAAT